MADRFGMVKGETLGVSSAIANLGKGLGKLDGDDLATFTNALTERAADIGSINNMEIKDIGAAFRVGLSGEQSDILNQLGVHMTETTVKAFALSHGIGQVDRELTGQEKTLARYSFIMEETAWAAGDLENTIGDPANAFRRLSGSVRNLGAEIGAALLPAGKVVLGLANNAVRQLGAAFQSVKPGV